jgi:hypothetical protein
MKIEIVRATKRLLGGLDLRLGFLPAFRGLLGASNRR